MAIKVIFSLDYEIHGNGDGDPKILLVEQTNRLIKIFNRYGAKLTIFADIAEIKKFQEYYLYTLDDKFSFLEIKKQLQNAVLTGHDVQLHIHSSYFKSIFKNNKWEQNWEEYNLAELPYDRINEIIGTSKSFLEEIIREVKPTYSCFAFRAANWSMMPTKNIANALINNGIYIDSTVYRYGKKSGRVTYDYTESYSDIEPWPVSINDINQKDNDSLLYEFPIYCKEKYFYSFITPIRMFRMIRAKFHKHKKYISAKPENDLQTSKNPLKVSFKTKLLRLILGKHPWKFDFNQMSSYQMIRTIKEVEKRNLVNQPLTLIGHSKSFIGYNELTIKPLLKYIKNSNKLEFGLFADFSHLKK